MDNRPRGLAAATPALVRRLAGTVRAEHAREVRELGGIGPAAALRLSLAESVEAYVWAPAPGAEPILAMGVGARSPLTLAATVWLLASAEADRHPRGVVRAARWGIGRAFSVTGAERLEQFIPAWYRTGLRFAAHLGFGLEPLPPCGAGPDLVRVALAGADWAGAR